MPRPPARKTIIRLMIIGLWIGLFAALMGRDYFVKALDIREQQIIRKGKEESFLGIYFQNERIGYVKHRLIASGPNEVELEQDAFMVLNILNENHPINMQVHATLTDRLLLKRFNFDFSSPFYTMKARGVVQGHDVHLFLTTGKETIEETIKLEEPPLLSTNQRGYLLQQDLKVGDKRRIPYFDPLSLSGQDTVVRYQGVEKVLILGRIHTLHHFVETFAGMKVNSWLDETGRLVKEESPAGFVFIAEPEFKATAITVKGKEILSSVSVKADGQMPADLATRPSMRYRLTLPPDVSFDLDRDRQSLDGPILTLNRETIPAENDVVCPDQPEELQSTSYIQAGNQLINELADELATTDTPPMRIVHILADWVFRNLEKRPVLGIPDARTTLETRRGDCNEHAVLFAALARNRGIPTRIIAGVTFHQGAFYYHAWNEVCLNRQWTSVDTTINQVPADLSHIKFVEGETREQVRIGALLGKLRIEILDHE